MLDPGNSEARTLDSQPRGVDSARVATRRNRRRIEPRVCRSGQAMVEFALILPILLLLIFSVIDFGYYFFTAISVNNSTRHAIRRAAMNNVNRDQIATIVVQKAVGTLVSKSHVTITTVARDSTRSAEGSPPTVEVRTEFDHRFWALGYVGINSLPIKSNYKSVVVTDPDNPLITF